ncbi:MAG: amidase [Actinomycetota bacterium]
MNSSEVVAKVRRRESSIEEITREALGLVDTAEGFGAITWRNDERALSDARDADQRLSFGAATRPLEGVPFTVKELLAVEGEVWDQGSAAFAGLKAPATSRIVDRLRAAGAILVAGTASAEFGALPTTENVRGACRNPNDPSRTSGGSSGGAAVCAWLGIPLDHGSDGGGSIRIPAACTGVVGLKPTRGRVSAGPLSGDGWGGLSVNGVLAPRVDDAAGFLDAVAGPAKDDPSMAPPPRRRFLFAAADRKPRRIGVAITRDGIGVEPSAERATRLAADTLADAGHDVFDVELNLDELEEGFGILSQVGIGATPIPADAADQLLPRVRHIWEAAQQVTGREVMRALEGTAIRSRRVLEAFARFDALLTPTLSGPAPMLGELGADPDRAWEDYRVFLQWTWPFNATGQPAITIPFGEVGGLPLGVQFVGHKGDEWSLLALGAELEDLRS